MSFANLPFEMLVQIFSHLDVRDLNTCRFVATVWRTVVDDILFDTELVEDKSKPVDFFTPLVERMNKQMLHQTTAWNFCQAKRYRRLYRSPQKLFADSENNHAKGYYKLKLSFFNLTNKDHFPRFEPDRKRFTLHLSVTHERVASYTFKENNIECQNPFIKI